jgi:phosphinothricin acetyltransferase
VVIREVRDADAPYIAEIYNHYIVSSAISFEEQPVSGAEIKRRIDQVLDSGFPWLVAIENDTLVGYAYANHWKMRSAYRFTVESSVYLSHQLTGKGRGKALYLELLAQLRARAFANVIGVIALPNRASIHLHESLGFIKVGEFPNIGVKFGEKRSVGYWLLEL